MKTLRNVFLFLMLIPQIVAHAAVTGEWIQVKKFTEDLYTERIQSAIETRIPRDKFTVSVNLNLVKIAKKPEFLPEPKVDKMDPFMPTLMGLVDAEAMLESFDQKLKELKKNQPDQYNLMSEYVLRSASVDVGLYEDYTPEYRAQLGQWLKAKVSAELRLPVQTSVQKINQVKEPIPPAKEKTTFDWFKDLEQLVLMALFSFTLFVCILVWFIHKTMALKQDRAMQKLAAEAEAYKPEVLEPEIIDEEDKNLKEVIKEFNIGALDGQELSQTRKKLATIFESLGANKNSFLTQMVYSGKKGRLKAVLLTDALLHSWAEDKQLASGEKWLGEAQNAGSYTFQMVNTLADLKSLDIESKKSLVQEVYWDLLGFQTTGGHFVSRPLEFVKGISNTELYKLFSEQDLKIQAFIYLFSSASQQEFIKKSIDDFKFKEMIKKSSELIYMNPSDIEILNKTIYHAFNEKFGGRVSFISEFEVTLQSLDTVEEISILQEAVDNFKEKGIDLRRMLVSLAFFPEWNAETKRKLLDKAEADEVLALIDLYSFMKDEILSYCNDFTREMVQEDIENIEFIQPEKKKLHLKSLKTKLIELSSQKEINYENAFEDDNLVRLGRNAA